MTPDQRAKLQAFITRRCGPNVRPDLDWLPECSLACPSASGRDDAAIRCAIDGRTRTCDEACGPAVRVLVAETLGAA